MIFNLVGSTISNLMITVHGGWGDSITLTNEMNGNKYKIDLTDTTLKKDFEIKTGTYSITSTYLEEVGASINGIKVDRGTTEIFAFPKNTVYWFGNGHKEGSYLLSKYGEYKTTGRTVAPGNENKNYTKFEDNYVETTMSSGSRSTYSALTTNANEINLSNFSTANFYGSKKYKQYTSQYTQNGEIKYFTAGNWDFFGISTDKKTLVCNDGVKSSKTKEKFKVDISDLEKGRIGILAKCCYADSNIDMYACWLE